MAVGSDPKSKIHNPKSEAAGGSSSGSFQQSVFYVQKAAVGSGSSSNPQSKIYNPKFEAAGGSGSWQQQLTGAVGSFQ